MAVEKDPIEGRGHLEQEKAGLVPNIHWSLTKEHTAWPRAKGRAVQCSCVCWMVLCLIGVPRGDWELDGTS